MQSVLRLVVATLEVVAIPVRVRWSRAHRGQEDHCFYKEVKYEEVRTIVGGSGARLEHDELGLPHRHELLEPEFEHMSLDEFGFVSQPVPTSESLSDAQSVSDSLAHPVLAVVVVWHVEQHLLEL